MISEIRKSYTPSLATEEALEQVPRELFVPQELSHMAYEVQALPLGHAQFISSPLTVAKMSDYLELDRSMSVLEIGLGSGYQACVLSRLARAIFSIERIEALLHRAQTCIRHLDIHNIIAKLDDGHLGFPEYAPYDRVLFSASIDAIPRLVINNLRIGGMLLAPYAYKEQQLVVRFVREEDGELSKGEVLGVCDFVNARDDIKR